jgi:4-aminobutyrate aminotransferase
VSTSPTIPPIDPTALTAHPVSRNAPQIVTSLPGPNATAWLARDLRVLSPSYTRMYPLVVARGFGSTIEDVDGNRFLDFTAGIAVTSTGHAHPEVVAAIADQAHQLIHMSGTDFYYPPEIELAERLAKLAPGATPKRVFFTNSGTESIEAALKLARYHTGRPQVISFVGSFHGRTYGAMSLGASKAIHRRGFGPLLPGVHHLPYDCARGDLEDLFATVVPPDEVAAIFVEPIQGEGGYRVPSAGFLPMLREVCDHHHMMLVMDEIQTGMGRTGRMFACQHFGPMAMPDILCLAKGIASGMPLGAMIARADLMDWPPGSHASTFGGNPVCCRAALATLDLIERDYRANAAARGDQLRIGLHQLATELRWMAQVRGLGLMLAFDVLRGNVPDAKRRDEFIQAAFHRGLLLLPCGRAGIRLCPPLCITAEEIGAGLAILRDVAAAA